MYTPTNKSQTPLSSFLFASSSRRRPPPLSLLSYFPGGDQTAKTHESAVLRRFRHYPPNLIQVIAFYSPVSSSRCVYFCNDVWRHVRMLHQQRFPATPRERYPTTVGDLACHGDVVPNSGANKDPWTSGDVDIGMRSRWLSILRLLSNRISYYV